MRAACTRWRNAWPPTPRSGSSGWKRLTRRAEDTLRRLDEAAPLLPHDLADAYPWAIDALNYIDRRKNGGAPDDCPLPELFAALTRAHPHLSVIVFHEGLRRLHERRAIRLRPADGLADLPQPEYRAVRRGSGAVLRGAMNPNQPRAQSRP